MILCYAEHNLRLPPPDGALFDMVKNDTIRAAKIFCRKMGRFFK
jgi:hypothetical protein